MDPNNTTLFIGGLSSTVTEAELHAAFARYGDIVYTKIPQVSHTTTKSAYTCTVESTYDCAQASLSTTLFGTAYAVMEG